MKADLLKISAAQIKSSPNNIDKNFRIIEKCVSAAAENGSHCIIFPELVDLGYILHFHKECHETPWEKYSLPLHDMAKKHKISIILGGTKITGKSRKNVLFHTSPEAALTPVYEKQHLFPGEENVFMPGSPTPRLNMFGIETGFNICYDLRFPEQTRRYLPSMPEILFVSAAWPEARIKHWTQLLCARAIENQCYVVAANRIGCDEGLLFGGQSLIINPLGEIETSAAKLVDHCIHADLDLKKLRKIRRDLPVLSDSKIDDHLWN